MKKSIGILSVLLILLVGFSYAQEQTGNLEGTVTDNEGIPLPGVTVTAESPALIGTQSSITDQEGRFRLRNLPPGNYTLTFELSGFATVTRGDIQVRLGRTYTVDVSMKPATIEEEVTVVGQTPVVDTKKSTSTFEINKEMFTKLPKGRNFTSAVTLSAGVTEESELAGMSFSGASSSENMFFVDGVDTTNIYGGTSGQNVTFEFIDEVQVKKAGYMAEYGGSMGGVVNVVTRSGGNEYHGQVLGYFQSNSLDGEPRPSLRLDPEDYTQAEYIAYPEDNWTRTELGFLLGGYLVKDRLWFFGSYIPKFQINNREVRFIQQPTVPKTYTRSRQWHQAQFKLTAQPLSSLRMSASWTTDYYQWRGELPSKAGTGNPDADYAGRGYNFPGWTGALHGNYIASDDLFFTFHAGMFRSNTESLTEAPGAWHYFIYTNKGMEGIPASNQRPSYWRSHQTYYTYDKDIRVKSTAKVDGTFYIDLAGEHMWKAGIQFNRIYEDVLEGAPYDLWLYYWGQNYEGVKVPRRDTKWGYMAAYDPYGTIAEINSDRWAVYLQDSWTISNKLTLNFGVRAEKEDIPSYVDPDSELAQEKPELLEPPISFGFMDKLAPRLGFAYDVLGDGSFKLFGSYGIYYDVMKLDMAEGSYGGFKWVAHYYEIPDAVAQDFNWLGEYEHAAGNPPEELSPYYIESLNWRIPSFETTQPDMEPYSKLEYTLGLQKRLLEDMSFTAQFLHNHIIWAIEDIGVQTPAGEQYFNGNPGSEWVNEKYAESPTIPEGVECPRAKRSYYSVELGFDKRFSDNWMAGLHYTWSRLWGNFSGLASSDEHGRKDPNVERYFDMWFLHYTADGAGQDGELTESTGLLPTDRPHRFDFYGAYTFPFGMTIGFNGYAMTGTPVSTEVEINNQDGYYPEGRNNLGMRTPFLWKGDVYAEYNMEITEGHTIQFNLNITNFTNNRIAQRIYNSALLSTIYLDNETIYNGYDWKKQVAKRGAYRDPRYKKEYRFQSPISVRLGVKFIF